VRNRTANLVLSASERGEGPLRELTRRIERALDLAGLKRTIVQPSSDRKKELLDHLVVIRDFLLAMAGLAAAIGGLALASAMSMNVMERTRELGVLRATGASTPTVVKIVVVEGVVLAGLSWVLAVGVAIPLSLVIGNFAGRVFVHTNLDDTFSPAAAAGWLLLVLLIGAVASALPALVSTRAPVARALQYE
jgi:putative ABC transport system permease protein